ncbi:site-specific integrase [Sphaerisporangium album]|uniref:Site-specific integrase n=1 Tax=Sphaerisporangium album TaxID=509200 RepID=A0A367EWB8_9ACTN|nr:site-specific integrase [Sphaerisporangium album]RCG21932.1 site-specific integrase [Sphaerisporangium album]
MRYEAPASPDGKRRRPWAGPFTKKSDADDAAVRLEAEGNTGSPIADRRLKVGPFLRQWVAGKKSLAESTRAGYLEHIDLYLEPGLGHLYLADLSDEHLEKLYQAMEQINRPLEGPPSEMLRRLLAVRTVAAWEGARPGQLHISKPLSPARIRRVHATLSSALSTARRQKKITHDPSKHIELTAAKKRRPLLWTPERVARWRELVADEAAKEPADRRPVPRPSPVMVWTPALAGQFLDLLVEWDERLYALYHLVITRGLRRGEAGCLEWSDTDLDGTKTISVLEDEEAEADAGIKSDSSRRVVHLDDINVRLLKAWRKVQAADQLAAGEDWANSGRVFTDRLGRPLDLNGLTDHTEWLVKKSGLPPVRLHDMRHAAATIMLAAGVDMKVVSATLGHRQYWFTADTYTNVVPELAEAAAEATVAIIPRRQEA